MKKIQKYKKQNEASNLGMKLASYTALAGAFLAYTPDVSAQCPGTAIAGGPLAIDIDGDGAPDLNINVGSSASVIGPYAGSTFIANYAQSGPFTASIFNPLTGTGPCGAAFTAFWSVSYMYTFNTNLFTSYYYFNSFSVNYAFATAPAGNQIVGLSSGASICTPACAATSFVPLGSAGFQNAFVSYFTALIYYVDIQSIPATTYFYGATAGMPCPTAGGAATYTSLALGFSRPLYTNLYAGATTTLFTTAINTVFTNTTGTTFIGVKFVGGDGDTYNGWVEVSVDPATSEVTCVDNGYNMCSIETGQALAGNAGVDCPPESNITAGTPTFAGACEVVPECEADGGAWPSGN